MNIHFKFDDYADICIENLWQIKRQKDRGNHRNQCENKNIFCKGHVDLSLEVGI